MSVRDELIQVAAVAIAIVTDLESGTTQMLGPEATPFGMSFAHRNAVEAVLEERINQEVKWGPQHHSIEKWLSILGEEFGEACRAANDDIIFADYMTCVGCDRFSSADADDFTWVGAQPASYDMEAPVPGDDGEPYCSSCVPREDSV